MNKEQVDELYHLLRCASNEEKNDLQAFPTQDLILGLARHLLAGGDYLSLIQFSAFYGGKFLLQPTYEATCEKGWKPSRIVEFGCGVGWLGRGLASKFGFLPALFIDKRPWALVDVVADLETSKGRDTVLAQLKDNDIIVMSDLLHCLDDPKQVMEPFSHWRTLVLEYYPTNNDYMESYFAQISRYGAKSLTPNDLVGPFKDREVDIIEADPYIILLAESGKEAN